MTARAYSLFALAIAEGDERFARQCERAKRQAAPLALMPDTPAPRETPEDAAEWDRLEAIAKAEGRVPMPCTPGMRHAWDVAEDAGRATSARRYGSRWPNGGGRAGPVTWTRREDQGAGAEPGYPDDGTRHFLCAHCARVIHVTPAARELKYREATPAQLTKLTKQDAAYYAAHPMTCAAATNNGFWTERATLGGRNVEHWPEGRNTRRPKVLAQLAALHLTPFTRES